jgi:hypothetical protein
VVTSGFGRVVDVGDVVSEELDVLDDGSGGGAICAALSVGVDEVVVDVVGGGAVVRGAEYDVVRGIGLTGVEGCWRELCAVWMTAYTRISTKMAAATPEA